MDSILNDKNFIWEYISKSLEISNRLNNRNKYDHNHKYKTIISFSEVGNEVNPNDDDGSFFFEVKVPRSVDNSLGNTLRECTNNRIEAAEFLRKLATIIEKGDYICQHCGIVVPVGCNSCAKCADKRGP